jgi:hypothetical protein
MEIYTTKRGMLLARAHAYAFYVFRRTSKSAWNDGLEDWKALALMSIAMAFILLIITCIISICLQRRVLLPRDKHAFVIVGSLVMIGFLFFNHHFLVLKHRWTKFEPEFRQQSKPMLVIGSVAVWLILVLIVAVAEWTGSIAFKLPAT